MTPDKELCSVPLVGTLNFQQRMKVAVDRAGGQTALARKIEKRFGGKVDPQRIQYLVTAKTSDRKPKAARGSQLTPQIAAVTGLRAEWLASGTGPRDEGTTIASKAPISKPKIERAGTIEITVKETGEMRRIEMTQDAIEVAIMFMDLSKRERSNFKRQLTAVALQHMDIAPDEQLDHLAAPGTPTAEKAKTKKPMAQWNQ